MTRIYARALFCISELLMIANQMFSIPGVLLHSFVVLETFEHDLAEAVKVGHIGHLRVEQLSHEGACCRCIVNLSIVTPTRLAIGELLLGPGGEPVCKKIDKQKLLTMVHRFTPYLAMRPLVIGADIWVM